MNKHFFGFEEDSATNKPVTTVKKPIFDGLTSNFEWLLQANDDPASIFCA